jgi:carboxymethylenebutenolidase
MERVRFPAGDEEIGGEIARPPGGAQAGLVLVPDVHGVSDLYRRLAGRFADHGHLTLVLDLYTREGKPSLGSPDAVARWLAALDDRRVLGDIDGAVRELRRRLGGETPIAITGFCVGGQYALMAACKVPGIAACVSFYGMLRYSSRPVHKPDSPLDLAPQLACRYLGLFGADDALIPLADVRELERILREHGKDFSIEVLEGAGHAFMNDTRPDAHRPEVADRAWRRAVDFLRPREDAR